MEKQTELDFDSLAAEPDEPEAKTETDYAAKPGAIWNGKIWACDEDVGI